MWLYLASALQAKRPASPYSTPARACAAPNALPTSTTPAPAPTYSRVLLRRTASSTTPKSSPQPWSAHLTTSSSGSSPLGSQVVAAPTDSHVQQVADALPSPTHRRSLSSSRPNIALVRRSRPHAEIWRCLEPSRFPGLSQDASRRYKEEECRHESPVPDFHTASYPRAGTRAQLYGSAVTHFSTR